MKTSISSLIVLIAVVAVAAFLTGCANINSGNVGKNIKRPTYKDGELAVVEKNKEFTYDAEGRVLTSHEKESKSGLAVVDGFEHGQMRMVNGVEESRAKGSSSGPLARLQGSTAGGYQSGGYNIPVGCNIRY